MKKGIRSLALTAATAWLAVGVAAAQAPPASGSSSAAKSITVTGCVQRAEKAATGTTGTAGASGAMADETKFVLKNAAGAVVQETSNPAFTRSGNLGACDVNAALDETPLVQADNVPVFTWDGSQ